MLGSIIEKYPLLAGIGGAVVAVLVLLVISAVITSRWGRQKAVPVATAPVARQEPVFGGGDVEPRQTVAYTREETYRPSYDVEDDEPTRRPRSRNRGRFGFAALCFAFLIGLAAGVGGMMLSSSDRFGPTLRTFAALANSVLPDGGSGADAASAVPPEAVVTEPRKDVAGPVPTLPSPDADASKGDVEERLAAFADRLKQSLPRDAGPELVLTDVQTSGMTVNLSYAVGRPVPDVEVSAFDAYVMRAIKSLFCGKDSRELRYLNDNGVVFKMDYVDPRGKNVANLTIPADFCA